MTTPGEDHNGIQEILRWIHGKFMEIHVRFMESSWKVHVRGFGDFRNSWKVHGNSCKVHGNKFMEIHGNSWKFMEFV